MKAGTKIKFWYWTGAVATCWIWIPSMIYEECLREHLTRSLDAVRNVLTFHACETCYYFSSQGAMESSTLIFRWTSWILPGP